ncbi:hypothetical protein AB1Y20_015350 [Prymnesium parvum]|uniref:Fe2OG dioxygenase domain-containing protein n=1 Tax=Prymnesium parvum TaxID=97485 RepID=A0AB34K0K6_PRYPA
MAARLLTVGDGDLSYSLALVRAFGASISLTATVYLSEEELSRTYANAQRCVAELAQRGVSVRYGINATSLDKLTPPLGQYDHIIFSHPHLGLADREAVAAHARRHQVLLAHFFRAASKLLLPGGCVHLTLCGNQPRAWAVAAHAARNGLSEPESVLPTSAAAFVRGASGALVPAPPQPEWNARRRFRDGRLGCKHWLSAYGYEHRRSECDQDMHVDRTVELLFRLKEGADEARPAGGGLVCGVCGFEWEDEGEMQTHVDRLGAPDPVEQLREWRRATAPSATVEPKEGGGEAVGRAGGETKHAEAEGQRSHKCSVCGEAFHSRNRLFAHLREGCGGGAEQASEGKVVRYVLSLGYVGLRFHGCNFNCASDETHRPTVGGVILAAARRAWGLGSEQLIDTPDAASRGDEDGGEEGDDEPCGLGKRTSEGKVVSSARSPVHAAGELSISFACRTERHASAAENWAVLSTSGGAAPRQCDLSALAKELQGKPLRPVRTPIRLFGSVGRVSGGSFLDVRHVALRQVYKYALPYRLLLTTAERASLERDAPAGVWVTGLPADATRASFEALLEEAVPHLREATDVRVEWPDCGGYAQLWLPGDVQVDVVVSALDGRTWAGQSIVAMAADEAARKLQVHQRVKIALKRFHSCEETAGGEATSGAGAKRQKKRPRSFHNFTSYKGRLRGVSQTLQALMHCSSAIREDLRHNEALPGEEGTPRVTSSSWRCRDWVVLSFAAREFSPQQVRRMAGVVALVVCGRRGLDFIDRCFEEEEVPTPLAPAEPMWLDKVQLVPKAQGWTSLLRAVREQLLTLGYAVVDDALVDHADSIHGMLCRLQSAQAFRQHRFAFKSSTAAPPQVFSKPHIFEAELQDEVVRAVTPDLIGLLQQLDLPHAANAAFTKLGLRPGNDGVQGVTVKLQLNLGQGGCFPAHFDNAGPPSKRRLSILCYFNPEWTEQCGGELELFPWLCPPALIPPKHGRIVLFQSDRVLHAVRPSFARRFCLTVWVDGESNSDASMNIRVPAHATSDEALTDLVRPVWGQPLGMPRWFGRMKLIVRKQKATLHLRDS